MPEQAEGTPDQGDSGDEPEICSRTRTGTVNRGIRVGGMTKIGHGIRWSLFAAMLMVMPVGCDEGTGLPDEPGRGLRLGG